MVNETANVKITLNSNEAQQQLEELQGEMKRLIVLKKKAEEAGDVEGYKKIDANIKSVNRSAQKLVKEHQNLEQVLKNINGASMNELRNAQKALTAQTDKLNRNTKEYIDKNKQLKLVKNEIAAINGQYRAQTPLLSRAAEGFNRYFGVATAAIASFTGFALTIKSSVNAYAEFDDKLSDVQKTTGLTKDQVKALNAELEKLDSRTSQEGLLELARIAGKLGISAEQDILAFVRAADKINIALSEDLGGNAEEAIGQLGKIVDIFKLKDTYGIEDSLLKVGSAINSLGAAGTANEAYMVEFTKRVAGIAPSAGISIQKVLGLAATLDELGQTSEVSGTVVNNVIASMFKDTATYAKIAGIELTQFTNLLNTDANEAFIKVLEGARGSGTGFAEMAVNLDQLGLDGARSTGVLAVLAQNIDKLREKQAFSNTEFQKGTSIITEYNTKNENAQAGLDKAKKAFAEVQRELGERLAPAYASVIHKGSLMLKTTGAIVEFLFKHGKALALATTAIVTYTIAVNAHNIATQLYNSLTSAATLITKGFNTAVKTNPIGLLISLLTTVATGFILFSKNAGEAKKAQSEFNDVVQQGNDLLVSSKTLAERSAIAKNLSKEQLASLKSDIESQVKQEDDFHATLLQKAKKRLDENAELAKINEQRKQANLTEIQKINLDAKANARRIEITRELEDENKGNQQRLKNLKTYLAEVNNELKNRTVDPSSPNTSTPSATASPFTIEQATDDPISDFAIKQAQKEAEILAEKQDSEEEWTAFLKQQIEERTAAEAKALDIEKEIAAARIELKDMQVAAVGELASSLASMFEQGSVAQIAMIAIEKAVAIAQIWINYAREMSAINLAAAEIATIPFVGPGLAISYAATMGAKAKTNAAINTGIVVAQVVASGVSSGKRKKTEAYATGKYPGLQTGFYGNQPHMAVFNEVPGYPEMVVDGVTTRRLQFNHPEIINAIYRVRDGRQPGYADGKYPTSGAQISPRDIGSAVGGSYADPEIKQLIQLVVKMTKEIRENPPRLPIDQFERERKKYIDIQQTKGL